MNPRDLLSDCWQQAGCPTYKVKFKAEYPDGRIVYSGEDWHEMYGAHILAVLKINQERLPDAEVSIVWADEDWPEFIDA